MAKVDLLGELIKAKIERDIILSYFVKAKDKEEILKLADMIRERVDKIEILEREIELERESGVEFRSIEEVLKKTES